MKNDKNNKPKLLTSLLLIAYGFVTVLTPNLQTLDSNGPKFLAFAILNVVVFFVLFNIKEIKANKKLLFGFFDTKIGVAYSLLMILSLLSFTKAINVSESILHFSKIFTPFTAVWLISTIVRYDRNAIKPLAVAMSILLFWDILQSFEEIVAFIKGTIPINELKGTYSNRNILSSAIFLKIPFALWLLIFNKKMLKTLGFVTLIVAILVIFLLATRAFLVGIILLVVLLFIYFILKIRKTNKKTLLILGFSLLVFASLYGIFYTYQNEIYAELGIGKRHLAEERLKTIQNTTTYKQRLEAWGRSLKLIEKEPLLGVGLGNWKLRVLEYENPEKSDFIYQYKAHNDFIEITSEVGIFGGLLFVSIFLFILGYFAVVLFRKKGEDAEKLFFLPAFGIIAYSVDAFFNFPQDRPEIQSLFALYVGIAVGLALIFFEKESFLAKSLKGILGKIMQIIALLMMLSLSIGSVYVLYQNFQSLKVQLVINQEINEGNLRSSSKGLMKLFPKIPNLNAFAEPIAVQKARYLIKEGKHKEAQNLLRQDKSNPFDGRREFFLTKSFYAQKQYDSAVYYAEKCYKLKPLFYKNSTYLASSYELSGRFDKAEDFWRNYLKTNKKNPKPWLFLARIVNYQKGTEETKKVLNQALRYHRGNKELLDLKASLKVIFNLKPALAMATSLDAYGKGNGANVGTYSSHNGLNQKWKLISLGKGIYKIVSMRAPNKVLDVAGGRYKKWTNIRLWEDNNGENQKWKIEQLIGEYYRIYPMKAPQFSLSVVGGNKKMANVALMPTSKTSKAQMWRFGEVKK